MDFVREGKKQNKAKQKSSFEGTSYKNLEDAVTGSFISCCFYWLLHQQIFCASF